VPNERCIACHRAELAEDTHAVRMFDDPRWAGTLEKIDALTCVTCHLEHRVVPGGATIARDFCFPCHDDVIQKRQSHKDLKADSCGIGGCHNYHDNTGLNTAFLKRHFGEAEMHAEPRLAEWGSPVASKAIAVPPLFPDSLKVSRELVAAWQQSIHAAKEVNCMDCHKGSSDEFAHRVQASACERCHAFEVDTFHAGKHGVSSKLKLISLRPDDARLPMKAASTGGPPRRLGCPACHDPHGLDTRRAATDACLTCHNDPHSRAFTNSKHFSLLAGNGSGARVGARAVTCASCHLPRLRAETEEGTRVAVNHNNSFTIRPRDRMVKHVCIACHGLEFSVNSIYDDRLVENNFQGRPARRHQTLEMIEAVVAEEKAERTGGSR
jgi:hypothetical protein